MTRPESEHAYLASLTPASVRGVSRRALLRGAVGTGALLTVPGALAACGGGDGGGGGSASGTVTLGSNQSDQVPKKAIAQVVKGFEKKNPDISVDINTIDHNTFQENINNYLQGAPDDVWMWFAGYRMRFFAERGLAGDVSDVWKKLDGLSDAFKKASTGNDGKQYFVPATSYPWAMFYRPSVFKANGYEVPKTLDDLTALGAQMKKDGLVPIAFADKDGWPAMGTFDHLNMRINGYDFHISLMAGDESWDSPKVKKVFDTWRGLLPLHQPDALGRTWQEAAQALQQKQAGTYLIGSFVGQQFTKQQQDDLDFFTFPEIDPSIGSGAIEAPIDGYMMADRPKNEAGAKKLLEWVGSGPAQTTYVSADSSVIAPNSNADTSVYNQLQKKSAEFIKSAESISQFMDRDTRPDFASTVMIPSLQSFLKNPKDVDGLVKSIQKQKESIFT